ncbi:MAG: aminoacetone oxidase family FAD-binding enzyme [Eubacterium sp.]|nr:aminoacetone oxidase family FAD-binding enzyme [Eubacterium sp.]
MYEICIIGGGAAGMAAALSISMENPKLKILLIEKKEKLGKKLAATGNGKCNISNNVLPSFGDTSRFFKSIGVEIKIDEEGRAYPVAEQASEVVKALENAVRAYGVEVLTNSEVTDLRYDEEEGFEIAVGDVVYKAEHVVLATGGKSAPQFGTTGDGYRFAKKLGHRVNRLAPALVPVECENSLLREMAGVRAKGKVTLYRHGFHVEEEEGEIQFTKDGLSGICLFNLSSYLVLNDKTQFSDYIIEIDLLNRYSDMEIVHILKKRREIRNFKTEDLMMTIVNNKLTGKLLKQWSDKKEFASMVTDEEILEIVNAFRHVTYQVNGAKGWKEAQCTRGGVDWDDFDWETYESKICKGLYIVGEVVDYNGPCGGYNLENAWNTARKAGKAICTEYMK